MFIYSVIYNKDLNFIFFLHVDIQLSSGKTIPQINIECKGVNILFYYFNDFGI